MRRLKRIPIETEYSDGFKKWCIWTDNVQVCSSNGNRQQSLGHLEEWFVKE